MLMAKPFGNQLRNQKKKTFFLKTLSRKISASAFKMADNANNCAVRMLCKQSRMKEALHILQVMDHHVDSSTYDTLLQGCLNYRALTEGKLVHTHMIQTGFKCEDISLGNKLVTIYAKCASLVDAGRVFDQMPERDVISCTTMVASYARHGHAEEALTLFYEMQLTGIHPDNFTFACVLPACANLTVLKKVHGVIIRSGFQSDIFVGSALVDMYAKCGSIENARYVFDKMPQRNVVSWNALITGYAQNGHVYEALKLFRKMPERNVISWTAMIAGYAQNGCVDEALKFFQKMPQRNVASWNAMIAGYAQNGNVEEAVKLFQKMPEQNVVSWTTMIAGYAQNGHVDEALELFLKMPKRDVVSWTAMITGYAQNGHVYEALKLFQKMPKRNVVSWNAMIAGYVQNGYGQAALELFRQMQQTGAKPNSKTFASVLSACANLAALEQGKEIHKKIIRSGFQSDIFVGNALVDMYAKCGSLENARSVFDKMPQRDVVSWTEMIAGYALHGHGKEALKLFEQMQHSGTNPDHVTFIGVLSACCHAGLVDEGWQYFHSMSQYYHITPTMEHYGCMVDLLGRAGRLDEAQKFIEKMPIKADATVWGCLLGAFRVNDNIELAEYVAEHLLELDPKNATPYVLLSNIYAAAGRWNDIENVRTMMINRGVKKKPGCSWIEVNQQVYSFVVGDRSHPQMQEIY
eukprot:Gb_31190 [translate_table: standard]